MAKGDDDKKYADHPKEKEADRYRKADAMMEKVRLTEFANRLPALRQTLPRFRHQTLITRTPVAQP